MKKLLITILAIQASAFFIFALNAQTPAKEDRPVNILFAIADDWGWPHAGAYGDLVVQTPTFDRLAEEGVLFTQAYVSSPSCTPSRSAILTGQFHWRLKGAANLWSVFPDEFATYPELLESNGYQSGVTSKGWGPGKTETAKRPLHGHRFKSFEAFLNQSDESKPFVFWLGTGDPHRSYKKDSGAESGMDLDKVHLFPHFPDNPLVRGDVADYYWEVQRFDRLVASAMEELEKRDMLENTIIVMTGDHGMPFPRCKSNLYDCGTRVPLAIRYGSKIKANRVVNDFVSLTDLAPTFLELGGVKIPSDMTGQSLMAILLSSEQGRVDKSRDHVLTGKERHVLMQEAPDNGGYPSRAIRTDNFLLIHNFTPDRWPNGTPNWKKATIRGVWLGDCDNSPTKTYIAENRSLDSDHERFYQLSFGKRPEFELYDLAKDPDQLVNVADKPEFAATRDKLATRLNKLLMQTGDPRVVDGGVNGVAFEEHAYLGRGPRHPDSVKKK